QRGLNAWHAARPFTGAALGTVGFILFASVIRATGITPQPTEGVGKLVYFAVAFVVGFREETFRQLIKRVADLIVGPGQGTTLVAPRPPLPPVFPPPPAAPAPARAAAAAPGTALVEPGLSPAAAAGRCGRRPRSLRCVSSLRRPQRSSTRPPAPLRGWCRQR